MTVIKNHLCFILLLGTIFYGCVPQKELQSQKDEETRKVMDSWKGVHKSKLIQSWGPPTRHDSDGQGGEILIYERTRTVGGNVYNSYVQRTFVDFNEIFADKDGIIYYWRVGTR